MKRKKAIAIDIKKRRREAVAVVEAAAIQEALAAAENNVTHAAVSLGISRKGLQLKMIQYGFREQQ